MIIFPKLTSTSSRGETTAMYNQLALNTNCETGSTSSPRARNNPWDEEYP